jgi:glutaredoxin
MPIVETMNVKLPLLFAVGWACLSLTAGPALAMYKVVGPDGSVTYTDRPPADSGARVTPLNRPGEAPEAQDPAAASLALMPFELRQTMQRHPVTLYTATDCTPCDSGRQLLRTRGVPFSERRIENNDDIVALERVAGGRTVPALTIGAQALRGFSPDEWGAYLDVAGYPRESRLPRSWRAPPVTTLAERRAPAVPPPEPEPPPPAAPALPPPPPPGAIRF